MINDVLIGNGFAYNQVIIKTRSGNEIVSIDKEDYPFVEELTRLVLYKDPKGRKLARAGKEDNQVLLHRHLFDVPKDYRLDWINGDTLDLRRENLQLIDRHGIRAPEAIERLVFHKPEPQPEERPKIKGVTFHKASQKWTSRPYWGSDRYSLGYFATKEEAENETLVFLNEGPESPKLKRNQPKGDKK